MQFKLDGCVTSILVHFSCLLYAHAVFQISLLTSMYVGGTVGESCRRMMRAVGTNRLWSLYSLKGKKGKQPLEGLSICRVVISKYYIKKLYETNFAR